MQKSGNNSPYLLATIMDLDKEDGLREKDTVKLKNAMEVNPYLGFNIFNKSDQQNFFFELYYCYMTMRYIQYLSLLDMPFTCQ